MFGREGIERDVLEDIARDGDTDGTVTGAGRGVLGMHGSGRDAVGT